MEITDKFVDFCSIQSSSSHNISQANLSAKGVYASKGIDDHLSYIIRSVVFVLIKCSK